MLDFGGVSWLFSPGSGGLQPPLVSALLPTEEGWDGDSGTRISAVAFIVPYCCARGLAQLLDGVRGHGDGLQGPWCREGGGGGGYTGWGGVQLWVVVRAAGPC